jgi:glycosyltransferase involved in cell wall biosynthesis
VRVGFVVTGGFDRSGRDVVPALVWLVERLARRHDLHVFALHYYRGPRSYSLAGATVHDIGRVDGPPGFRRLRVASRLRRAIADAGPFDLLHAYWGVPAALTTAIGAQARVPVVVTLDSGELVSFPDIAYGLQRRWIDRRALARAIANAARVTVCTDFMARRPALAGVRVDIVPLGVDLRLFPASPRPAAPPWRLLRVASINAVKDYPMLLRALAAIVAHLPAVHLDVVGVDTLNGSMQALAATLGVGAHVTFHGFQPTAALAAFYGRAHLHVVSSRHEAANVATLEAAAAGVPTVGTDVGYLADWAPDGRSAVVPVGDHDALAAAAIDLLTDVARRERMGAAARAWAAAHDADWTAARFERIYQDVSVERIARSDVD